MLDRDHDLNRLPRFLSWCNMLQNENKQTDKDVKRDMIISVFINE